MQFLDTHLHLMYPDRFGYGWTAGIPPLHGAFTLETYADLAKASGIGGAIFMEAAPDDALYQDEVRFVLSLMCGVSNLLRGVIAGCRPETDAGFDAWLDETSGSDVVGYRRALHVLPDETSTTAAFRRNVQKTGARDKSFDLCVTQAQLPIGRDLARACPNTMFVLNHCGVPAIAGGDFAGWAASVDELAALPNVVCKISGVGVYVGDKPRKEAVKPYVEHCFEIFGADRVVWGGDWPVVNLAAGLPDWAAMTRELTASLSDSDRAKFFAGNARRIYRIKEA
jgi:predicted TIM-barrel fold metal-dependent hydrolase